MLQADAQHDQDKAPWYGRMGHPKAISNSSACKAEIVTVKILLETPYETDLSFLTKSSRDCFPL